jgi:hypothetical protein
MVERHNNIDQLSFKYFKMHSQDQHTYNAKDTLLPHIFSSQKQLDIGDI